MFSLSLRCPINLGGKGLINLTLQSWHRDRHEKRALKFARAARQTQVTTSRSYISFDPAEHSDLNLKKQRLINSDLNSEILKSGGERDFRHSARFPNKCSL